MSHLGEMNSLNLGNKKLQSIKKQKENCFKDKKIFLIKKFKTADHF